MAHTFTISTDDPYEALALLDAAEKFARKEDAQASDEGAAPVRAYKKGVPLAGESLEDMVLRERHKGETKQEAALRLGVCACYKDYCKDAKLGEMGRKYPWMQRCGKCRENDNRRTELRKARQDSERQASP